MKRLNTLDNAVWNTVYAMNSVYGKGRFIGFDIFPSKPGKIYAHCALQYGSALFIVSEPKPGFVRFRGRVRKIK